ncbi:hypothetical protein HK102_005156 [Quaeritorhiza haematococci]|nr:hypothetical protein HK102_005156 [Quaeritorhiza haematococci]
MAHRPGRKSCLPADRISSRGETKSYKRKRWEDFGSTQINSQPTGNDLPKPMEQNTSFLQSHLNTLSLQLQAPPNDPSSPTPFPNHPTYFFHSTPTHFFIYDPYPHRLTWTDYTTRTTWTPQDRLRIESSFLTTYFPLFYQTRSTRFRLLDALFEGAYAVCRAAVREDIFSRLNECRRYDSSWVMWMSRRFAEGLGEEKEGYVDGFPGFRFGDVLRTGLRPIVRDSTLPGASGAGDVVVEADIDMVGPERQEAMAFSMVRQETGSGQEEAIQQARVGGGGGVLPDLTRYLVSRVFKEEVYNPDVWMAIFKLKQGTPLKTADKETLVLFFDSDGSNFALY